GGKVVQLLGVRRRTRRRVHRSRGQGGQGEGGSTALVHPRADGQMEVGTGGAEGCQGRCPGARRPARRRERGGQRAPEEGVGPSRETAVRCRAGAGKDTGPDPCPSRPWLPTYSLADEVVAPNPPLQQTAAAMLVSRRLTVQRAAAAAERDRSTRRGGGYH